MDTLPAALEEEAEDEPLAVVAAVSLAPRTDTPLMMLPPLRFEEYVTVRCRAQSGARDRHQLSQPRLALVG